MARNELERGHALTRARTIAVMAEALAIWSGRYRSLWVHNDPLDPVPELGEFLDHRQARPSVSDVRQGTGAAASRVLSSVDVAENGGSFHRKVPALIQREVAQVFGALSSGERFRMTSDRLLDPRNAPNRFEQAAIERLRSARKGGAEYQETVGGQLLYARSLSPYSICLHCHAKSDLEASAAMSKDAGSGVGAAGQETFAGIVSVSVPLDGAAMNLPAQGLATWLLAVLVPAGWAALALWLHRVVVRRAEALVSHARGVLAESEMAPNVIADAAPEAHPTRNEIDRLGAAVRLLCRAIHMSIHGQRRGAPDRLDGS